MGLIYKITNTVNNKIYVGFTTRTIEERVVEEHFNPTIKTNEHLKNAIKKYGIKNFIYETIVEGNFSTKALSEIEKHYVWLYNSWMPKYGYNKTKGGEDPPKNIWTEERKKKHSELMTGRKNPKIPGQVEKWKNSDYYKNRTKPVLILNSDLEIIKELSNPREVANFLNGVVSSVGLVLTNINKTYKGFAIIYKNILEEKLEEIKNDTNYFKGRWDKKVKIINIKTNEITIFNFIKECIEFLDITRSSYQKSSAKKSIKGYLIQKI